MSITIQITIQNDDQAINQDDWKDLAAIYRADPQFRAEIDQAAARGDKGAVTIKLVGQQHL